MIEVRTMSPSNLREGVRVGGRNKDSFESSPPETLRVSTSPQGGGENRSVFGRIVLMSMMLIAVSVALAACGTKGPLQCPKGTQERIDGTCQPPG